MSRRGAGSPVTGGARFELVPAPALARRVVALAKELLREGLAAGEVASLFTDAAQFLSKQKGGMPREEWLALCAELYDFERRDGVGPGEPRLTAPGGVS